jgi:cytoskeletal protein RodZ
MKSFGDRLKEARQARGFTLDAIAGETNIGRRYLDALERNDLDALPGGPFDKGYIRSYAQFLGIDPQPILDVYSFEQGKRGGGSPESERQMLEELSRMVGPKTTRKRTGPLSFSGILFLAFVVVLVGLVAVGSWFLFRGSPPRHDEHDSTVSPVDVDETPAVAETRVDPNLDNGPEEPAVEEASKIEDTQTPTEPDPSRLAVSQFGVGTGVVDRRLIGESDSFPEGTEVWFWTRVVGGKSGESLRHLWFYDGRTIVNAVLTVGGSHWRTFSSYRLPPGATGSWTVEARNAAGAVLARKEFLCIQRPRLQTRR